VSKKLFQPSALVSFSSENRRETHIFMGGEGTYIHIVVKYNSQSFIKKKRKV